MIPSFTPRFHRSIPPFVLVLAVMLSACDSGGAADGGGGNGVETSGPLPRVDASNCNIDISHFADGGVPPDGIPALTNPELVSPDEIGGFLTDDSRVIGFFVDGQAYAVPHNILWWHEIANFDLGATKLAVTYCPLTGSSIAFDRAAVGGGTFGVSGLLYNNNLTMYDRTDNVSLWPQMIGSAGCGARVGTSLTKFPVVEMTWGAWKTLYPESRVVSSNTGFNRNYRPTGYPYGDYEELNNPALLDSRTGLDRSRPPKERGLGIPVGTGGMVFPFGLLDDTGKPVRAVHETVGGEDVVVFWDEAAQTAMAYRPRLDGQRLTFSESDGKLVDAETGSVWDVSGRAVSGPKAGARLEPVAEAYIAFWFAWAVFQPDVEIWNGGS